MSQRVYRCLLFISIITLLLVAGCTPFSIDWSKVPTDDPILPSDPVAPPVQPPTSEQPPVEPPPSEQPPGSQEPPPEPPEKPPQEPPAQPPQDPAPEPPSQPAEPPGSTQPPSGEEPSPPQALSSLRGIVKLEGTSVVERPIKVTVGSYNITTNTGTFTVEDLAPGKYVVRISAEHYQTYESLVTVTSEPSLLTVTLQVKYSPAELDLFARLVYAEAAGEPFLGKVAVAATVLNRMADPNYPDTISEVINQVVVVNGIKYYQYSPVLDGRIYELDPRTQPEAYATAMNAIYQALAGRDPSLGATGFYNPAKVSPTSWVRQQPVTTIIGNHVFFR